jgi:Family of unknown function (DUF6328)
VVTLGNRILQAVLVGVVLVLTGTVLLIFDVVVGRVAGIVAGSASLVVMVAVALALPLGARRRGSRSG